MMKEALQPTLILVLWIVLWLAGTVGGAVLQAWLIDIGVLSEIDPPWIITIGSSLVGFFAGGYAAVKLGDLKLRQKIVVCQTVLHEASGVCLIGVGFCAIMQTRQIGAGWPSMS
jgi:hypothetical protein